MTSIGPVGINVIEVEFNTCKIKKIFIKQKSITVNGRKWIISKEKTKGMSLDLLWVSSHVKKKEIAKLFAKYGRIIKIFEPRSARNFVNARTTKRTIILDLKPHVQLCQIPRLLKTSHGTILTAVPGCGKVCFQCLKQGHIRANCKTAKGYSNSKKFKAVTRATSYDENVRYVC